MRIKARYAHQQRITARSWVSHSCTITCSDLPAGARGIMEVENPARTTTQVISGELEAAIADRLL